MLYYLFDYLDQMNFPGAGLFHYISFRAGMALIFSLIVSMVFGKKIIRLLQKQQIGETVRHLGLEGQLQKSGTPTMGGIIILSAILIPTLLFAKLHNIYVITMIIATIWLGLIGFLDDYIKVFKKNKEGLAGKFKVVGQVGVGLIVGCILYFHPDVQVHKKVDINYELQPGEELVSKLHASEEGDINHKWIVTQDMTTTIPFTKNNEFNYNWLIGDWAKSYGWLLFIPVVIFIVIAVSNGANMTDGLDGLATGTSAIIGIATRRRLLVQVGGDADACAIARRHSEREVRTLHVEPVGRPRIALAAILIVGEHDAREVEAGRVRALREQG